jgi:hypothetical protein
VHDTPLERRCRFGATEPQREDECLAAREGGSELDRGADPATVTKIGTRKPPGVTERDASVMAAQVSRRDRGAEGRRLENRGVRAVFLGYRAGKAREKKACRPRDAQAFVLLVAKGGIEPPTQGFSVLCSTN